MTEVNPCPRRYPVYSPPTSGAANGTCSDGTKTIKIFDNPTAPKADNDDYSGASLGLSSPQDYAIPSPVALVGPDGMKKGTSRAELDAQTAQQFADEKAKSAAALAQDSAKVKSTSNPFLVKDDKPMVVGTGEGITSPLQNRGQTRKAADLSSSCSPTIVVAGNQEISNPACQDDKK